MKVANLLEESFETPLELVQFIADQYRKNIKAEEVTVIHKKVKDCSVPKACFNNAFKYILSHSPTAKYVLGYVVIGKLPIEHAWVKEGDTYIDTTLASRDDQTYIKLFELDFKKILKFASEHGGPTIYDAIRNKLL